MTKSDRQLIFGLSNAQAAATLAAVIIGHDIGLFQRRNTQRHYRHDFSDLHYQYIGYRKGRPTHSYRKYKITNPPSYKSPIQNEQILIPVANPDTIENLINLALLLKSPQKKSALYALHVTDAIKKQLPLTSRSRICGESSIFRRYEINPRSPDTT